MATIHFYKLDYLKREQFINSNKQEDYKDIYLSFEEFEKDFKGIIKKNINKENCILLEDRPNYSLIEILEYGKSIGSPIECDNINDCDFIFGRLGRKKDINDMHRRNQKSFESVKIEKKKDEEIEVFTYFKIFFERHVKKVSIAYLTSLSAPNIRKLNNIITRYHTDRKRMLDITPIITKDVAKMLKKKQLINAVSYKLAVPTDKILGLDGIGLTESVFEELENVKSTEIVITITAQRNKNLLKDKGKIEEFKDHIYKTHKGRVKDCLAKAKDEGQNMLPYHFLDNEFITKAKFKYTSQDGDKRVEEIKKTLVDKYILHRGELLDYMK
ncbi:hypothetical protein [Oceanirhabdus sp. W0125-5]|uniref:hypothetical protein n=1 Tax=Oceanirhabdus sp. W0125-5 TaxID=2999116 RepID=UPI0022F32861|nr:hypothetical protein [Oceanirhabdus sp. W0125-5]WBW95267.1 hypothetical protein OW730_16415 [Oceanirhabdus sp. W0125-5]